MLTIDLRRGPVSQAARVWLAGLSILWCAIALAACDADAPPPASTERLRLGLALQPSSALLMVALDTGAFAAEGLEVRVSTYASGKRALRDGLLAGAEDLVSTADVPVALAAFDAAPIRVLASICSADNVNRVAARADLGVAGPGDLAGRRVATQRGSAVHFFWHLYSLRHGIHTPERLRFLPAEALPAALADGEIHAFSMREPYISQAADMLGEDLVQFAAPGLYAQRELLVTTAALAQARAPVLRALLRALLAAERFCERQPARAQALVAARLNVSAAEVAALWPGFRLRVALGQELLLLLEEQGRWALRAGLTTGPPPNYLRLLEPVPLAAERPTAVTLIR